MTNISGLAGWTLLGVGAFSIYEIAKGRNPWTDLLATAKGVPLPAATHLNLASQSTNGGVANGSLPISSTIGVTSDSKRSAICAFALSKVGGHYVWGGNGPTNYDCSGLTYAAYKSVGITIPRVSGILSTLCTRYSSQAQALPGDFVFYGYPADHVGIYLGGGQMVAADNPSVGILHEAVYPYNGGNHLFPAWYGKWRGLADTQSLSGAGQSQAPR